MPRSLTWAEDQHSPCYANQVPEFLCMHSSLPETQAYWIWVQNTLNCFWWRVCKCYEVCYITVLTGSAFCLEFSLCVYVRVRMYMCDSVYIACVCVCICVCEPVPMPICIYGCFFMWTCACVYMCVCMNVITSIYPKLLNTIELNLNKKVITKMSQQGSCGARL